MESKRVKAALVFCVLFVLWIIAKPFLSEVDPVIVKDTKEEIRRETGVRELLPPDHMAQQIGERKKQWDGAC